ncbi:KDO2-lipid IV(A) lauroyltransferase [Desulfosalsimonas propionicica]|uniref:KDO2-lipid IV(A) lauroyltransferase n=1 Tax=Desulfosalsimonas propionicica TaxID=332175 RepID=A0A7W0CCC2_9BACT|nr:lysophospholipid acyltransferase family protein [Desulfosalsimonas propionicica]MBA2883047.1 KDO2-lipid IV(A) lauroyltransferase [Desulfosalsimonas propionicica]
MNSVNQRNFNGSAQDPEKRRYLDAFFYFLIVQGFFLIGLIPRKTAVHAANWLGRLWFAADRRHREIAVSNIGRVFGGQMTPQQIRAMARSVFCSLVRIVFEIGWSLRLNHTDIRKHFRFSGMHHLQAALGEKKGVLVLTGHIGNWELLPLAMGQVGLPVSAMYRPLEFEPLDRFFISQRSRYGARLLAKRRAMRGMLSALHNNELIGMLLDQNARVKDGVFVDFFGSPACTGKGMALLARRTGAPVVPVFLVREKGYYRVECHPALPKIETRDKTKDIEAATALYNKVIEDMIRRYPQQWFWVHHRWKTKPFKPWAPKTGSVPDKITDGEKQ